MHNSTVKGMNKEIGKKWVENLRSGKYQQGTGKLKDSTNNTFCCLGVLCDMYINEHRNILSLRVLQEWEHNGYCYEDGTELPLEVSEWAGLSDCMPTVKDGTRLWRSLASLNDGDKPIRPRTFKQIANYIERSI